MEWHVEFLLAQAKQKLYLASTSFRRMCPTLQRTTLKKKSESGLLIRGIDPKLD